MHVNLIWYLYPFMLNKICLSLSLSLILTMTKLCYYVIRTDHVTTPFSFYRDVKTTKFNQYSSAVLLSLKVYFAERTLCISIINGYELPKDLGNVSVFMSNF